MSGRPITTMLSLKKKGLRGHEAIWEHILNNKSDAFTIRDIDQHTNGKTDSVRDYLKRLVKAGYVVELDEKVGKAKLYRLIKRQKKAPRLSRDGVESTQGTARSNLWRTIKMIGAFTARDLAISASTKSFPITENYAADYVHFLSKAGYLKKLKGSKAGGNKGRSAKQAVYRLIPSKNTGPKAPMIQRIKSVYDPNLERVVWMKGMEVRK
ncbi:MAG: hypothetical protein CMP22_07175 [Rickettsiales bacterium]|nr:hypothetical protein [Rickettsiales bacterium]